MYSITAGSALILRKGARSAGIQPQFEPLGEDDLVHLPRLTPRRTPPACVLRSGDEVLWWETFAEMEFEDIEMMTSGMPSQQRAQRQPLHPRALHPRGVTGIGGEDAIGREQRW